MIPARKVKVVQLLYISGLDATGYREIYKTYMHFSQISDNGKSTRKKSSSFFSPFLDNTPPVRILPIF